MIHLYVHKCAYWVTSTDGPFSYLLYSTVATALLSSYCCALPRLFDHAIRNVLIAQMPSAMFVIFYLNVSTKGVC